MRFDFSIAVTAWPILLAGLVNTVKFCAIATVLGLALAAFIALARISRRAWLRWPAACLIEIVRNTPFLVQAYLVYFALPRLGLRLDASVAGIIVLTIYGAAYFAESIRGAILSVPKGQLESARVLGMPYFRAMRRIVFPQMLGYLIPSLGNQTIGLVKDSAALSVITVPEIAMAAQIVVGQTFSPIEAYAMVALLYWLLTALMTAGLTQLERRFAGAPASPTAMQFR